MNFFFIALLQKVKLLIIDEVHLLHEDRGAVIESIIARTLRQVESTQSLIRIVGLSATLPNYLDVAAFLRYVFANSVFYGSSSSYSLAAVTFQSQSVSRLVLLRQWLQTCTSRAAYDWYQRKGEFTTFE